MNYYLILDVGTTNIKSYAYTEDGKLLQSFQKKSKPKYPHPGWVEQDPGFIVDTINKMLDEIIEKNGRPLGVSLTNQRSTTIVWDKQSGEPLYDMITWQDTRTMDIIKRLSKKFIFRFGKKFGKTTKALSKIIPQIKQTRKGAYIVTLSNIGFGTAHSSMHLRWMIENVPEVKKAIDQKNACFGNLDSWVAYNLTGRHVTDYTNASATGLFDPFYVKWSENILEIVDIPHHVLPDFVNNDGEIGTIKKYDVPFLTMIADQQASMYMAGVTPGDVSVTSGTGAFINLNVGKKPVPGDTGIYPMVALSTEKQKLFMLEGAVNSMGSAVDWLKDMGFIENYGQIKEAFDNSKKDNILFIPSLSGLNSPYLRPDIKSSIYNITRDNSKQDFVKALIRGIAMRTSEVIDALEKVSDIKAQKVIADGGVAQNDEYLQLMADLSNKNIYRPKNLNGSAYGAFMLSKKIHQKQDIIKTWKPPEIEQSFKPKQKHEEFKKQWKQRINSLLKQ
ncbi:MAG: FGGY family carbohydrate kinase [Candidatus Thermoplasmatota archaeon]